MNELNEMEGTPSYEVWPILNFEAKVYKEMDLLEADSAAGAGSVALRNSVYNNMPRH